MGVQDQIPQDQDYFIFPECLQRDVFLRPRGPNLCRNSSSWMTDNRVTLAEDGQGFQGIRIQKIAHRFAAGNNEDDMGLGNLDQILPILKKCLNQMLFRPGDKQPVHVSPLFPRN